MTERDSNPSCKPWWRMFKQTCPLACLLQY